MAAPANGPQILERICPAGLGLDDVIDLGSSADADVGVAQLTGIAVPLEHPHSTLRPVTPVGVAVRRWLGGGEHELKGVPVRWHLYRVVN
jgi:hypothetical protein